MTLEFWRMGVTPAPITEIDRLAREFENDGWTGLVVGEGCANVVDPYLVLALSARATTSLRLGTATSVPVRHPMWAANAMISLHTISAGRTRFNLARGDGSVLSLGRKPVRVDEFEQYLQRVQGYLRREDVDLDGYPSNVRKMALFDPSIRLDKPPLDVAVTGPRMIAIGARYADGVNFAVGADTERIAECIRVAERARVEAGSDAALELGCFVQVAVTGDVDRDEARRIILGSVMTHAHFSAFDGRVREGKSPENESEYAAAARAMNTLYDQDWTKPGGGGYYPDDALSDAFVDRFGIVGDADYCADRLVEIASLGIHRFYIQTRSTGTDVAERNAARFAAEVIPAVRRRLAVHPTVAS